MDLKNQCCSLEQSKKLKELGVKQDNANFYWGNDLTKSKTKMIFHSIADIKLNMALINEYITPPINLKHWLKEKNFYATFTVAELGIMLPEYYPSWRFKVKNLEKWISTIITKDKIKDGRTITTINEFDRYADNEAQARATLLIALLENDVIKVSDVNKRLIK